MKRPARRHAFYHPDKSHAARLRNQSDAGTTSERASAPVDLPKVPSFRLKFHHAIMETCIDQRRVYNFSDLLVSFLRQVDAILHERPVYILLGKTVEFQVEVYEWCLLLRRDVANGLDILLMQRDQIAQVVQPPACEVAWLFPSSVRGRGSEQDGNDPIVPSDLNHLTKIGRKVGKRDSYRASGAVQERKLERKDEIVDEGRHSYMGGQFQ